MFGGSCPRTWLALNWLLAAWDCCVFRGREEGFPFSPTMLWGSPGVLSAGDTLSGVDTTVGLSWTSGTSTRAGALCTVLPKCPCPLSVDGVALYGVAEPTILTGTGILDPLVLGGRKGLSGLALLAEPLVNVLKGLRPAFGGVGGLDPIVIAVVCRAAGGLGPLALKPTSVGALDIASTESVDRGTPETLLDAMWVALRLHMVCRTSSSRAADLGEDWLFR